jgi:hypothetical protein
MHMAQSDGKKTFWGFVFLIAFGWAAWFFVGGDVESGVAYDAIEQYNIAKRTGVAMDACVHAGIVRVAFLKAKDEANYQKWKIAERRDCRSAGMPDGLTH